MALFNPYKESKLDISLTSVGAALMVTGLLIALICGQLAMYDLPADSIALKHSPSAIRRDGTIVPREQIHTEIFRKVFGYARVAHLGGGIMILGSAMVAIGHGGRMYRLFALAASAGGLAMIVPGSRTLATLAARFSEPPPLIVQSPVEEFRDMKGNAIRMEPTPEWGAVIRSAGPDGEFETEDDVILAERSFFHLPRAKEEAAPDEKQAPLRIQLEGRTP